MAIVSEAPFSHCYDIKSADLPLVALLLKTTHIQSVSAALTQQLADSPDFFDQEPLVIDVSALSSNSADAPLDLEELVLVLRQHGLIPLAIKGAQETLLASAAGLGLVNASDARIRRPVPVAEPVAPPQPVLAPPPAPVALGAMVIDKPLRSGQQVYAKGRDLVVLAVVNPGAEVIADGNIHIYGALRGKAIAGARGNVNARIFAQSMEPELVSIAGVYRTSENPLAKNVLSMPAQVCLQSGPEGDKLLITPLKP
ncbi:septum site-determining protein MinC [Limnohabitans sp. T6-5]|uniref:septum site-determining protein MinC n=1 Tax=Limnohabitans sp. T6-5 TaxID=1100724 RepID=UPI000D3D1548|nr:septum site-determining protein MinC [Limnohabitans sp. T6-5]PUE06679.1 septum site-determining protein MinC [Limnohabitans sp. T6-5]